MHPALRVLLTILLPPLAFGQFRTTLKPETIAEFDRYRGSAEAKMAHQPRYPQLRAGAFRIDATSGAGSIDVSSGMVHDWVGATVVANATVDQAVAVLQNYPAYPAIYSPEVAETRLLSRSDDRFHIYLKLIKRKVLTAVLNTEHDVDYQDLGNGRWAVTSRSTRIAEVEKDEELPVGTGYGFLWRLNSYWLIKQQGNAVYLECRSISLSRDIPHGMGFAIRPFVTSVPRESLKATLDSTVKALANRELRSN